jgi:hypothetical protein
MISTYGEREGVALFERFKPLERLEPFELPRKEGL